MKGEGNQSFATPKHAFWDIDDFQLVIFRRQKTQKEPLTFLLTVTRNLGRGPAPGRELSPQITIV